MVSNTPTLATRIVPLFLLAVLAATPRCSALQFILEARTKRCFREDIPLNMEARLTYTIAQGDGDMPVTLRVTDVAGKLIHERASADHGVVPFTVPDSIPNVREKADTWALRDDERDEDDAGVLRAVPGAVGDNRLPYAICFEHPRSLSLPRLGGDRKPRRRVIFKVAFGTQTRDQEFYDKLAKEKHLTSTEELFRVVEDRVGEIVRGIDEMRQRELRMAHLSMKTSRMVATYGIVASLLIVGGAVLASTLTTKQLNKKKAR